MRWQTLLAAVLVGTLANGQGFNRRYDAFDQKRPQGGWDIEMTSEGYAVISVSSDADSISPDTSFYHYSVLLTRLDWAGNKLNEARAFRPWHSTTSGWANCSDTIPGGGFVIGGASESVDAVDEVCLMRLNEAGDTLWTRIFGALAENWVGYQVKHTHDTGFLIVGAKANDSNVDGFALKTDSSGTEQWRETYGSGATDYFVACHESGYAHYFMGGQHRTTVNNKDLWVQRIDTAGQVVWSKIWGTSFDEPNAHLFTASDGHALIASAWGYADNFDETRPYMAKLDSSDGSVIWQHEYGPILFNTVLLAVKERPSHDLIACGVGYVGGNPKGLLLRTTSEGDSIWMRTYYYQDSLMNDGTGRFYDVLPTADGGFIAAGGANFSATLGYPLGYSQDTWVVKVDSMGCIVPGCDGVGVSEIVTNLTNAISVFPNPAHGSAVVQVDLPVAWRNAPDLRINVVNAQGQVVAQQHAAQGDNTLELSAFSAGLYYVHLSAGSTWLSGTKLMIE